MNQKQIEQIVKYNTPQRNYDKLEEELVELLEVIIKRRTKTDDTRPTIQLLIGEMGDVLLRMKVIAEMENIREEVNNSSSSKLADIISFIGANNEPTRLIPEEDVKYFNTKFA